MNKFHVITLLTTSLGWSLGLSLGLSQAAIAADNGIYLGAAAGSVESSVNTQVVQGLSRNFEGKAGAYKIILGVRPLDWLAAEVNYLDLGQPDSNNLAADTTALSGSAVLFASMGPTFELFAKGGVVNWKSKITDGATKLGNLDGTNPVYGGGLIVNLLSLSIRAEYEHFDMDVDSNLLSLGVTWTFL